MSVTLSKMSIVASAIVLMVMAGSASAVSLGLPEGKMYYGRPSVSGQRMMRSDAPATSAETRQSFSYEPAEGETMTSGPCGCGGHHHAAKRSDEGAAVAQAPQTERRSFSYQPSDAAPARSFRSTAPKKDPWLIPKSDPRRYSR